MNPATKQYLIFSGVIALVISFLINFVIVEFLKGTLVYGFPFSLNEAIGLGSFIIKLLNTLIIGSALTVIVYYTLMWLIKR